MNIWGDKIKISIFGESHGNSIGIVIDGLPAGIKFPYKEIDSLIERRKTGKKIYTSTRVEEDKYEILSGVTNDFTNGSPLTAIFKNKNVNSSDYNEMKNILRPSHSDYPAKIKFSNFNDYRGGGHFSGRLTLALVFAGGIAKSILLQKNIKIFSHIKKVLNLSDESFLDLNVGVEKKLELLEKKDLPFLNSDLIEKCEKILEEVKEKGDTVGGEIECAIFNVPIGLGNPFFNSLESKISHLAFSIPAVKGITFGIGNKFTEILGSEANDNFYMRENEIKIKSNNNGGIFGGLSNGLPIVFSLIVKPIPSIMKEQKTVDYLNGKDILYKIKGKHDSTIITRILPVVESIAALVILDEIL